MKPHGWEEATQTHPAICNANNPNPHTQPPGIEPKTSEVEDWIANYSCISRLSQVGTWNQRGATLLFWVLWHAQYSLTIPACGYVQAYAQTHCASNAILVRPKGNYLYNSCLLYSLLHALLPCMSFLSSNGINVKFSCDENCVQYSLLQNGQGCLVQYLQIISTFTKHFCWEYCMPHCMLYGNVTKYMKILYDEVIPVQKGHSNSHLPKCLQIHFFH